MLKKIKNIKKVKLENLYLVIVLTLGLLIAFINPPFAGVPDEHAHYWKAWSVAEGYWKCTGQDKIPATAQALPDQIKPIKYEGIKEEKIVVAKLKEKLFEKDTDGKATIGGANCPSTPFGYIPQSIGLKLGSIMKLSALGDFYLARIFALLAAIVLFYVAIRIIPFGKMVLLVVGLLPMTIRQFASMSYDGLALAFAVLFLAYVLKLSFEKEKKIGKKEIGILLLLSLVGLNVKLGYFAMAFLIFILPIKKFSNKKQYWLTTIGLVSLNVLVFLAVRTVFKDIAVPDWTDPAAQLRFVLYAPFHFIYVMFNSYYGADGFIPHLEGMLFKVGNGASLDSWLYVFMFAAGLLFIKNVDEEVDLSVKQRWIMFLVFLMNFTLIYLALYLGWTKVGEQKVSGVQGRYLLVLVPLFVLTFYKAKLSLSFAWIKKNVNVLVMAFVAVTFFFVFKAIYDHQYDKTKRPGNPVYQEYLNNQK